VILNK